MLTSSKKAKERECDLLAKLVASNLNEDVLEKNNVKLREKIARLTTDKEVLSNEIKELVESHKKYEADVIDLASKTTSTTFYISDDLTTITPHTKVAPSIIMKLVEAGYLASNMTNDKFAINLAIMTITEEATQQIVSSFEEELADNDKDYRETEDD